MKYRLSFHPAAAKDLYKLTKRNKQLGQVAADQHFPAILKDPFKAGKKKEGDLSHVIRGYGFTFQGITYRIVYTVEGEIVRIIAIGTHDIAYRRSKERS
jgi:mRNA-degrading endonuclease RelE of RelBE toxin-antitoxin system